MTTLKLCRLYHGACPHCLPPVDGSWGLTARGMCRREAAVDCVSQMDPSEEHAVDIGDSTIIVAGYKSKDLLKLGPMWLYDVLPQISPDEWEILVSFARDYTARGIPWMVARRGKVFTLLKKKG
jgi:hypothetical protein